MRPVAILVCLLAAPAGADTPSSQHLERTVALYDRGDYFSASIEIDRVFELQIDTRDNLQRAEMFRGKILYRMGFRVPRSRPQHRYFTTTSCAACPAPRR